MVQTAFPVSKVTDRKTLKVVDHFTNGFAQKVYKLEDGTMLFIDLNDTEIEIVATEPFKDQQDMTSFNNTLPDDKE